MIIQFLLINISLILIAVWVFRTNPYLFLIYGTIFVICGTFTIISIYALIGLPILTYDGITYNLYNLHETPNGMTILL